MSPALAPPTFQHATPTFYVAPPRLQSPAPDSTHSVWPHPLSCRFGSASVRATPTVRLFPSPHLCLATPIHMPRPQSCLAPPIFYDDLSA